MQKKIFFGLIIQKQKVQEGNIPKISTFRATVKFQFVIYFFTLLIYQILLIQRWVILILDRRNLKYNRIDMKRRTSQKVLRPSRKMASSTKQLPLPDTASDSLKAPKKKQNRKNRQFGDDITNIQKQPVFQPMQEECSKAPSNSKACLQSQIQPYLSEIGSYIQQLDDAYNLNVVTKLNTKSSDSTQITFQMRKILVKWIIQVADKFKANQETVHICVQIIDYILVFSHKKIDKKNFQLLGIAALFVASKYNEIYTPEAKKYVFVCDGLYTMEDLFSMESYILTLTNFNLQFPTVNNFIGPLTNGAQISEKFKKTVSSLSQIIVLDFNLFNRFKKFHVSGVMLYLTARLNKIQKYSAQEIMRSMDIDEETFKNCFSNLMLLYRQYLKPMENQDQ